MQTLEASLSLLIFLSAASVLAPPEEHDYLDDSIYRLQLANDAWRVLQLRGLSGGMGEGSRPAIEAELDAMGKRTGLCYFIRGMNMTNCRSGDEEREITSSVRRIALYGGEPEVLSVSVGR